MTILSPVAHCVRKSKPLFGPVISAFRGTRRLVISRRGGATSKSVRIPITVNGRPVPHYRGPAALKPIVWTLFRIWMGMKRLWAYFQATILGSPGKQLLTINRPRN